MSGNDDVAAELKFYAYWARRGVLPAMVDALGNNEREFLRAVCLLEGGEGVV